MSVSAITPHRDVTECRDATERRFLERLNGRAERGRWCADSWSHLSDHVLIDITLTDGGVMGDVRADFFGDRLVLGYDETHQFVTELDRSDPEVTVLPSGSPEELADAAADWFKRHLSNRLS